MKEPLFEKKKSPEERLLNAIFPEKDPEREPTHDIQIVCLIDGEKVHAPIKRSQLLEALLFTLKSKVKLYKQLKEKEAPEVILQSVLREAYEAMENAKKVDENIFYECSRQWGSPTVQGIHLIEKNDDGYYLNEEKE